MTLVLVGTLVVLALVDSTSIGTLVVPLWWLLAPGRLRVRSLGLYLGTVVVFYLVVGLALLAGLGVVLEVLGDALDVPVVRWVQAVLGAGLLVLSFRTAAMRGAADRILGWRDRVAGESLPSSRTVVSTALVATGLEVATMLPYLAAIALVAGSGLAPVPQGLVIAGYCIVMVLPAMLLTVLRLALHDRVEPLLRRLDAWTTKQAGEATGWVVGIVGFLLLADAVQALGLL